MRITLNPAQLLEIQTGIEPTVYTHQVYQGNGGGHIIYSGADFRDKTVHSIREHIRNGGGGEDGGPRVEKKTAVRIPDYQSTFLRVDLDLENSLHRRHPMQYPLHPPAPRPTEFGASFPAGYCRNQQNEGYAADSYPYPAGRRASMRDLLIDIPQKPDPKPGGGRGLRDETR